MKTKLVVAAVLGAVLLTVGSYLGWLPGMQRQEAAIPEAVSLPSEAPVAVEAGPAVALKLPRTEPTTTVRSAPVRVNVYPWTALHGLMLANGGPVTTRDSLMEKNGVNVRITVQNDLEKSKAELLKLATLMADGQANPSEGTHFVIMMGDGSAAFIGSLNQQLLKLGDDYRAEVVGAIGYSRGEDAWWGPQAWKDNPEAMKGGTVAAVLRDGDWALVQYKLANDQIKNNPDETTWDPDAMNWFATADHLKAVELYVSGYCEERPVVRSGKLTNEKRNVCVDSVSTWTPGDVNLAKNKGGLVKLISTKENAFQMPATIIGIRAWNVRNARTIENFLLSAFEGADMIKQHEPALSRAGQAAYAVYAEQSPAYWVKYYKGATERDKQQQPVQLGGSVVANLADNLVLFGLADGAGGLGGSVFKATYEGFGRVAKQQYPNLIPDFPPVDRAVNTAFISALAQRVTTGAPADVATFTEDAGPIAKEATVAKRDWSIQFDTGKATFTPAAEATLNDLYQQLVVGSALAVQIDGHTDNVGNPVANQALSEARAFAVKSWLEAKAPRLFPAGRVNVRAFGQGNPIASNSTPDGRARNRRVTITLGTRE